MNLPQRLAYAVSAALLGALVVLLISVAILGFSLVEWTRTQAALVGVLESFVSIAAGHGILLLASGRGDAARVPMRS
jgi:hypothetical protein